MPGWAGGCAGGYDRGHLWLDFSRASITASFPFSRLPSLTIPYTFPNGLGTFLAVAWHFFSQAVSRKAPLVATWECPSYYICGRTRAI